MCRSKEQFEKVMDILELAAFILIDAYIAKHFVKHTLQVLCIGLHYIKL